MYCPSLFREDRPDVLHASVRNHPLGLLISHGTSGLLANYCRSSSRQGVTSAKCSRPICARQSAVARTRFSACARRVSRPRCLCEPLSVHHQEGNREGRAHLELRDGTGSRHSQITGPERVARRSDKNPDGAREASRAEPWAVTDAPRDYIETQMKNIVGIEIEITALEGKWKVSQNQPEPIGDLS